MASIVHKRFLENSTSVVDVCKQCLQREERIKILNAFISVFPEKNLHQANESEKRLENGNVENKLDGIPIAIKDNFCVYNEKTTCASKMLENFVAPYDATVVKRLKDAGAIIFGKTNLDEFAMGSGTVNSIFGPTKNIWGSAIDINSDLNNNSSLGTQWRIAGGSSGGSAVAVATGVCFAAIGSDTGGSTRNPASYCGVVGFKPTYGTVSRYGLIPLVNSMDVPGILARKVDDVADIFNVIAGHDDHDSTTVEKSDIRINLGKPFNLANVCVGIPKEYGNSEMSSEVKHTWTLIADKLSDNGAIVKEISMPHTESSIVTYSILNQCEVASNMSRYSGLFFGHSSRFKASANRLIAESRREGFSEVIRARILAGNYFLLKRNYEKYFVNALKVRRLIWQDFQNVWASGVHFLLTPTTLSTAPLLSDFISLDNRTQCSIQDYCTQPANMAGCPAISIPIRLSEDRLPLSLQIMAPNFHDDSLLSIAKWIESAVNFPHIITQFPLT